MRARRWGLAAALGAGLAVASLGCTFLVAFDEKEPDSGDLDAALLPDVVDEPADLDAAADAAPNACTGQANGFNWDAADPYARCCNGLMVRTVDDQHCGTCEIACNTAKGQACELYRDHYYCRGCDLSTDCWSGCCSKQFGGGSCAASDCTTGACNPTVCKGGTVCVVPGDASNYCRY